MNFLKQKSPQYYYIVYFIVIMILGWIFKGVFFKIYLSVYPQYGAGGAWILSVPGQYIDGFLLSMAFFFPFITIFLYHQPKKWYRPYLRFGYFSLWLILMPPYEPKYTQTALIITLTGIILSYLIYFIAIKFPHNPFSRFILKLRGEGK